MIHINIKKITTLLLTGALCIGANACGKAQAPEDSVNVADTTVSSKENNSELVDDMDDDETAEMDDFTEGDAGDEFDPYASDTSKSSNNSATYDDSLWGTKKLVSGQLTVIYQGSESSYPIAFEYATDGSYKGTIQDGGYDFVYLYTPKGIIDGYQEIQYSAEHPDGELSVECSAFYGLIHSQAAQTKQLLTFYFPGVPQEASDPFFQPVFDVYGNLSDTSIFRTVLPNGNFWGYADLNPQIEVEKSDGLVSKAIFTYDDLNYNGTTSENSRSNITEYEYSDSEVTVKEYLEDPEQYDETSRSFGVKRFEGGIKIIKNSHGVPEKVYSINEDDTPSSHALTYDYDAYGNIICISEEGNPVRTLEYEYEDGTITKYEN